MVNDSKTAASEWENAANPGPPKKRVKIGVSRITQPWASVENPAHRFPPRRHPKWRDQQENKHAWRMHPIQNHPATTPRSCSSRNCAPSWSSGESFDLLPIKHEQDVKTEVESLVQSWAESGFLVHGRFIYPWHQVKQVEVTEVEEMPLQLAHQRFRGALRRPSAHARRKTSGVLAARPRRSLMRRRMQPRRPTK